MPKKIKSPKVKKTAKSPKKKTVKKKKGEGDLGGESKVKEPRKEGGSEKESLNWTTLKYAFFSSGFGNVMSFLKDQGIIERHRTALSGFMQNKTKGWAKEKKQLYIEQEIDIRENFRNQAEEIAREVLIDLKRAKTMTINAILERLANHRRMGMFGHVLKNGDLIQILNVIKTELGEPSTISASKNTNANIDINKLLAHVRNSDKPVDPFQFDKRVYGDDLFNRIKPIVIDGREQLPPHVEAVEA